MEKSLELFLRNKNVVNQNFSILEKNPYKYMSKGLWVTEYRVHLLTKISGLSLLGIIKNYENGTVEISLTFSTYGDLRISDESYNRREKIIAHIVKHGAVYFEEPPIKWFN